MLRRQQCVIGCFFFVSGFCSITYQTIWLRLAFAKFGVITPVLSVVVSIFMLGLAVGSGLGGKFVGRLSSAGGRSGILLYSHAELITAAGGIVVPAMFSYAAYLLLSAGALDSFAYLALSTLGIAVSILPWAIAMGCTFPFAMSYLSEISNITGGNRHSFGYLYLANAAGATLGAVVPALVLIEIFGFRRCLTIAALCNLIVGLSALVMGWRKTVTPPHQSVPASPATPPGSHRMHRRFLNINSLVLFTTGLTSMAMEIGWTRLFTSVLGNVVYSFAMILAVYLASTSLGAWLYRLQLKHHKICSKAVLLATVAAAPCLVVLLNDPRFGFASPAAVALLSIVPFCASLGYLTPYLIDEMSLGEPEIAGLGYSINVVGGIIGPLLMGYMLLPLIGVKWSLVLLALPLIAIAVVVARSDHAVSMATVAGISAASVLTAIFCWTWEEGASSMGGDSTILRDYAATTVCCTHYGDKQLLVNGVKMTQLCRTTKFMAHMPLSILPQAKDVLVICFGMGTTYRSFLSWPVNVTAVELVPGVKTAFPYFWADADRVLKNPRGQIVIDDGRRYLQRSSKQFDVITVDPPPPVEAAGSSLLYSREFYTIIKKHLKPDGLFCQWYPASICADQATLHAVARSIRDSFPYVTAYQSLDDNIGLHFFCSNRPIANMVSVEQVWNRMPDAARKDLLEFEGNKVDSAHSAIRQFIAGKVPIESLYKRNSLARVTDDRPFNEYYWLRRTIAHP